MRLIELNIGGIKSVAKLMEDKSPIICDALWTALPLEAMANHAKFAGEEVFFTFSRNIGPPNAPRENPTWVGEMKPGQICLHGSMMVICYGEMEDERLPMNLIAQVTEDTFNDFRSSLVRSFRLPTKIEIRKKDGKE
jgi:hypothetical protein